MYIQSGSSKYSYGSPSGARVLAVFFTLMMANTKKMILSFKSLVCQRSLNTITMSLRQLTIELQLKLQCKQRSCPVKTNDMYAMWDVICISYCNNQHNQQKRFDNCQDT